MRQLTWDGKTDGGDITVEDTQGSAVELIARHMASVHFRANGDPHPYAVAHHLHATDPKLWELFKAEAIFLIRAMHGSGEKGLGSFAAPNDSRAYFDALHDLAATLRAG